MRPKGAKDEVKRPFLPFPPILPILHCRGAKPAAAKPAAAKPAASKADYSRPRQTIADQGRPKHSDIRGATSISDAFIIIVMSSPGYTLRKQMEELKEKVLIFSEMS